MRFPLLSKPRLAPPGEIGALIHPTPAGWMTGGTDLLGRYGIIGALLPGSSRDWAQEVGDPALNYAVHGCLRWIQDNLPEPVLSVGTRGPDNSVAVNPTHPLLALLAEPNEAYDGDALLGATARDYCLTGNAYWIIERDNLGRPRKLWYVPFWMMTPTWPADGSRFIQGYLYRPAGTGRGIPYPIEDVIHFQWGLDGKTGGRIGVHRTMPVLTAIASLNEGAVYSATLLRNMGIVPYLITADGALSEESRVGLRQWFQMMFTRDGRGKPGVLDGGKYDVKQIGMTPENLALNKILDRPELAICMAFGIHPGVLYLASTGGKGFDNGGQLAQARRASYHDCLLPVTKRLAKTITRRLLPAWEDAPASQVFAFFDFAGVEALQEDQDALHARARDDYTTGIATRNEARAMIKLPPVADEAAGAGAGSGPADSAPPDEGDTPDDLKDADDAE